MKRKTLKVLQGAHSVAGELKIRPGVVDQTIPTLPSVVVEDSALEMPQGAVAGRLRGARPCDVKTDPAKTNAAERDRKPERRRSFRVPYLRSVRIHDGDRYIVGEIVDISVTGLLLRIFGEARSGVNGAIAGRFYSDGYRRRGVVVFRGTVVRSVVWSGGNWIGVDFSSMAQTQLDRIDRVLDGILGAGRAFRPAAGPSVPVRRSRGYVAPKRSANGGGGTVREREGPRDRPRVTKMIRKVFGSG